MKTHCPSRRDRETALRQRLSQVNAELAEQRKIRDEAAESLRRLTAEKTDLVLDLRIIDELN